MGKDGCRIGRVNIIAGGFLMQEKKTIREFMEDYETALIQSGMRIGTRLHNVMRANKLVLFHEKEGKEIFGVFQMVLKKIRTGNGIYPS